MDIKVEILKLLEEFYPKLNPYKDLDEFVKNANSLRFNLSVILGKYKLFFV